MIGPFARSIKALVLSWFVSQKPVMVLAKPSKEDLAIMRELMETGKVTPVIDKRYRLESGRLRLSAIWKQDTLEEK